LSKILRQVTEAPTVIIGDIRRDPAEEAKAEDALGKLFPEVSVATASDGSRHIPVAEFFKIEQMHLREKETAFDSGFKKGHETGYEEGLNKGLGEARDVLERFDRAIKDAVNQRAGLLEEAKQHVLDLVVKISRKVTCDAVRIDQDATAAMITGVINQLIDKSKIKVKVHPDQLPLVEQNIDRFLSGSSAIKQLSVEGDSRVRFGGCFIETPTGDIDARLESQFDVIDEVLRADED
jgi:flagellar assembly protein FliH